jgi:hypothetical protein
MILVWHQFHNLADNCFRRDRTRAASCVKNSKHYAVDFVTTGLYVIGRWHKQLKKVSKPQASLKQACDSYLIITSSQDILIALVVTPERRPFSLNSVKQWNYKIPVSLEHLLKVIRALLLKNKVTCSLSKDLWKI